MTDSTNDQTRDLVRGEARIFDQGSPARQSRAKLRIEQFYISDGSVTQVQIRLNRKPSKLEAAGLEALVRDALEGGE